MFLVHHLLQITTIEAGAHRFVVETFDVFAADGPRAAACGGTYECGAQR